MSDKEALPVVACRIPDAERIKRHKFVALKEGPAHLFWSEGLVLQSDAAAALAQREAEIQRLREALKGLMEYAGLIEERCDSIATDRARAALAAGQQAGKGEGK